MAKKPTRSDGPTGLELLKQDLKSGQFGRLYLFCGEEAYLRDHYLQALQDKLLDGPARDFNYHRFTPETTTMQTFSDALDALPMLAQRTLRAPFYINLCLFVLLAVLSIAISRLPAAHEKAE